MKKILACLFAMLFVASLAGCGGSASEAPKETEVSTTEESTLPKEFTLYINTEGSGSIAYAEEGGTPAFNDKYPSLSAEIYLTKPSTYVLAAKPIEGYKFVKWTKDGEDFSKKAEITISADKEVHYVAVFGNQ